MTFRPVDKEEVTTVSAKVSVGTVACQQVQVYFDEIYRSGRHNIKKLLSHNGLYYSRNRATRRIWYTALVIIQHPVLCAQ